VRAGHRLVRRVVLAAATTAAVLVFVLPAAAGGAITLRDYQGGKLASFPAFTCSSGKGTSFAASAADGKWKLTIEIAPFDGFHAYHVGYAKAGKVEFFARKAGVSYTNTVFPRDTSTPETGEGGELGFPGGGGRIGLSFGTAFAVEEEDQYASLFGLASCK
jgi:hypothetical protein